MAIESLTAKDIKEYLTSDKQNDIHTEIRNFLQNVTGVYNNELSTVSVIFQEKEWFYIRDDEWYVTSGKSTKGRYCPSSDSIAICAENLAKFVNDFTNLLLHKEQLENYPSDACIICDLVLLHEYMHAYQHKVEKKILRRGCSSLEEEANRRAIDVMLFARKIDEDFIRTVMVFWGENAEFGFGDHFSIDELLAHRNDTEYLLRVFSRSNTRLSCVNLK